MSHTIKETKRIKVIKAAAGCALLAIAILLVSYLDGRGDHKNSTPLVGFVLALGAGGFAFAAANIVSSSKTLTRIFIMALASSNNRGKGYEDRLIADSEYERKHGYINRLNQKLFMLTILLLIASSLFLLIANRRASFNRIHYATQNVNTMPA